jgi:hypothetical protein
MRPPFGEVDAAKPELVGANGQPHDHVGAGFKRCESDADPCTVDRCVLAHATRQQAASSAGEWIAAGEWSAAGWATS